MNAFSILLNIRMTFGAFGTARHPKMNTEEIGLSRNGILVLPLWVAWAPCGSQGGFAIPDDAMNSDRVKYKGKQAATNRMKKLPMGRVGRVFAVRTNVSEPRVYVLPQAYDKSRQCI